MFLLQGLSYEIMDRNEDSEYPFPDVNELYETFEEALEKFNQYIENAREEYGCEFDDDEEGVFIEPYIGEDYASWSPAGEQGDLLDAGPYLPSFQIIKIDPQ